MSSRDSNVLVLFSKVAVPPSAEPQSAISHFGWNVPDARVYLERFRTLKFEIVRMYSDGDGGLIDISSDGLPGYLTRRQIVEAKARGAAPARSGGFQYLRGPDGALIESYGDFPAERFTHIHMVHRNPICAQQWYAQHLGATVAATHLHLGPGVDGPSGSDAIRRCERPFAEPTYPAFEKSGRIREPSGNVLFDDVGLPIWPYPGALVTTRQQTVDHIGLSVADLDATIARLKNEGVGIAEPIHRWGTTRAALIEGPDHVVIELVEVR